MKLIEIKGNIFFLLIISVLLLIIPYVSFARDDDSHIIKCGTFHHDAIKKIKSIMFEDSAGRPKLKYSYPSKSGHFLMHYDITGRDAVPPDDNDHNGIPDYIDSAAFYFDHAYNVEVNQLSYNPPPSDTGRGGSDAIDVYFVELGDSAGNGYYGYTDNDLPIHPEVPKKNPRFTSYMVLDNNYSETDSIVRDGVLRRTYHTFGIDGMKITAAHEFHHCIQFAYGMDVYNSSFNEMVSTYMEQRLYPEIDDYLQYIRSLLKYPDKYPFGVGTEDNGYGYSIFAIYLTHKFNDSVFVIVFNLIGNDLDSYSALDSTLKIYGSSLTAEYCNFIYELYFTGSRAKPNSFFKNAVSLPEIKFFNSELEQQIYSPPSLTNAGALHNFEFRLYRCIFKGNDKFETPDTADVVMANIDINSSIKRRIGSIIPFALIFADNQTTATSWNDTLKHYFGVDASDSICYYLIIRPGIHTRVAKGPFPNPYDMSVDNAIYFPVPEQVALDENVELTIFSIEMQQVFYGMLKVGITESTPSVQSSGEQHFRALKFDQSNAFLRSGVYIYNIKYDNDVNDIHINNLGKFAVVRSK